MSLSWTTGSDATVTYVAVKVGDETTIVYEAPIEEPAIEHPGEPEPTSEHESDAPGPPP